ncbi:MAG: DUF563 domain-containing protein, partial [Cyclonatronaceae bacterium]
VEKETVPAYLHRKGLLHKKGYHETIHESASAQNPLPCNVKNRNDLPDERGWWGYSFRDVPTRVSGETFIATLPDCKVVTSINPADNDFWVAILNSDERSLELNQITFRPWHARVLRSSPVVEKTDRATWFLERVYDNHSHWLTAHLPKLILLKKRGMLNDIILPPESGRTEAINSSLQMLGINPADYRTFDPARPLLVKELTVMGTDRFRPELLQSVRDEFSVHHSEKPHRRIYISRAKAARRKLINEDQVWPVLEKLEFEKVFMEDLSFMDQVVMMQQAAVVVAPHGAAITNILFCRPGTHVLEIADLNFPNPNFYALASAMGHHYWILNAESVGNMHPLEKDLQIDPEAVKVTLAEIFNYRS